MKQKSIISIVFFLLLFSSNLLSQPQAPNIEWQQVIGRANINESGRGADSTPDGGYAAGGTALWEGGTTDNLIVKFNSDGDSVWARSIGTQDDHEATNSFIVLPDGRYVSAGYHNYVLNPPILISDTDALIMIAEPNGDHLNTTYYGNDSKTEMAMSVCQALDSDLVFTGIVDDDENEYESDLSIYETNYSDNVSGGIIWKTIYNEDRPQHPNCIYRTLDGGYIIVGKDQRAGTTRNQGFIYKTLISGALVRMGQVYSSNYDGRVELFGVTQLADSSIIITGLITYDYDDSNIDLILIKYNANLTEEKWKKTFGDADKYEVGMSIDVMPDGGFVVGGTRHDDFWVIRFNEDGDILWEKTVGTDKNDFLYSIKVTDDNGFIMCGDTQEKYNPYRNDMLVIKLGPEQEVDQPPVLAAYIVDIEIDEDADDTSIDISNLFTDPDNDDSSITKTVQSVTNPTLITATIDGNLLTIDYLENQFGTATVTIRGTSNGLTVDEVFEVKVNPVNDAPTGGDSDVNTNEDVAYIFQETDYTYNDIENNNFAGIKIISGETSGDLDYNGTDITDNTDYPDVTKLRFTPETDETGSPYATFLFKVKDDAGAFSVLNYTMTINVTEINDPPTVANALPNIEVNEDAANTTINLSNVFTDSDNDDSAIIIAIQSNSNSTLLSALIDENNLTLDYQENQFGSATLIIRGTSSGQTIDEVFEVTVNAINDPPTGGNTNVNTAEDISYTFQESDFIYNDIEGNNFAGIQIVTGETLGDLDYDGVDIIENNDYSDVSKLVFIPETNGIGSPYTTFTYYVKDDAGAFSVLNYTMTINVTEVDDPPVIALILTDVEVDEDSDNTVVDLSGTFTDPDNEDSAISKSVQVNSNPTLLTALIVGDNLTLDYLENQFGTAEITIRGTSNSQIVEDVFNVNVNSVNDGPQVFNLLNPPDNTIMDITAPFLDSYPKTSDLSATTEEFSWENSIDVEADGIEYLVFYVYGGDTTILIANTELTTVDVPHDSLNEILISQDISEGLSEISGEWFVLATDGTDTTECSEKFYLTISNQHVGIDENENIATEFKLFDNFPNPFNPTTSIKYCIPKKSNVNLSIYNSAGHIIDVLVDKKQTKGFYIVRWDAFKFSSGIYIIKIVTDDFSDVKKCILMK